MIKSYDFYYKTIIIGKYTEEWNPPNRVKLSIQLYDNFNLTKGIFIGLRVLADENRFIDDKGVRFFIENRVTPAYQDGIEDKLRRWGLDHYSQLGIFHAVNGMNPKDHLWVKFHDGVEYLKDHPNGKVYGLGDTDIVSEDKVKSFHFEGLRAYKERLHKSEKND